MSVSLICNTTRADGAEILGPPSILIANGTGVRAAGAGLDDAQPGNITIELPAGVTVSQAILYWEVIT